MPIYQPLIPTGTVKLSVDYQNIQDNFNQSNVVYGTDHYPFDNNGANEGFHDKVTMPVRANPTTTAGQGIVYTKDSAAQPGRSDLYYAYETDAGKAMTGQFFPLNACKGFGKVDSGGLVAGTSFNVTSATLVGDIWTVTLTSAPSNASGTIMVLLGSESSATSGTPSSWYKMLSTNQFEIHRSSNAIGGVSFWVVTIG